MEDFTNSVYEETKKVHRLHQADYDFFKDVKLNKIGSYEYNIPQRRDKPYFTVRIIENVKDYVDLMKFIFNFESIQKLLNRKDFSCIFDGMHGVAGPYLSALFG